MTILPPDSAKLIARAETSMVGVGKIKEGFRVNIKLDNYPYLEFGIIQGTVRRISKVSEAKTYNLEIDLENGLETTLKKRLDLSQRMSGKGEIITKDRRLISRIFDPIVSLLNQWIYNDCINFFT